RVTERHITQKPSLRKDEIPAHFLAALQPANRDEKTEKPRQTFRAFIRLIKLPRRLFSARRIKRFDASPRTAVDAPPRRRAAPCRTRSTIARNPRPADQTHYRAPPPALLRAPGLCIVR